MFRRPGHPRKCFKTGIIKNAFRWSRLPFVRGRAAMNPLRKTWRRYDEKEGGPRMTTREALHQLVDQLPENQAELAHVWLLDLRDAADEDGPPFGQEALASLDRGLADLAAGRVKPLAEYERERGL